MVKVGKFVTKKYLAAKNAGEYNGKQFSIDSTFPATINDDEKLCIRLSGIEKPIALNQTNLSILQDAFGDESDAWVNQKVAFHIVKTQYNGQTVDSIQLEPIK